MKKVIKDKPKDTVDFREVSSSKFYAWSRSSGREGDVGFAIRSDYDSKNKKNQPLYIDRALHEFEKGNHWKNDPTPLKDLIELRIELGFDVYEFDTVQELFNWLSKQSSND